MRKRRDANKFSLLWPHRLIKKLWPEISISINFITAMFLELNSVSWNFTHLKLFCKRHKKFTDNISLSGGQRVALGKAISGVQGRIDEVAILLEFIGQKVGMFCQEWKHWVAQVTIECQGHVRFSR